MQMCHGAVTIRIEDPDIGAQNCIDDQQSAEVGAPLIAGSNRDIQVCHRAGCPDKNAGRQAGWGAPAGGIGGLVDRIKVHFDDHGGFRADAIRHGNGLAHVQVTGGFHHEKDRPIPCNGLSPGEQLPTPGSSTVKDIKLPTGHSSPWTQP